MGNESKPQQSAAERATIMEQPTLWSAVQNSLRLASQLPPIPRVDRTHPIPLCPAQKRLWLTQQANPAGTAYNLAFAWRISGALNVTALRKTISAMVQRHEIFRTTYVSQNDGPVQVISPTTTIELCEFPLHKSPEGEPEALLTKTLEHHARLPFDLSVGPLLRPYLYRLEDQEHVFMLALHHIVTDGGTLGVLFREIRSLYQSFSENQDPSLPEQAIQYADYAKWISQSLSEELLKDQLAFWKQKLAGELPILELPADRPRPAAQSFRGASCSFVLPAQLSGSLHAFRRKENTTLFNLLLAAFKTMLFRYTGQEDIIVGAPTANRNRSELQSLVGFFSNTIVLRTPVSGEIGFRQLLERVKEVSLEAYGNQDVPFERLVEELKPKRNTSHSPLFQVMFAFQGLPRRGLELPGLASRMLEVNVGAAKFDLTLDVNELAEGIRCVLEYNSDLFDAPTIRRMAGHYENLLVAAVANPDTPLCKLALLSPRERHEILVEWNATESDFPRGAGIAELFEDQVSQTPNSIALIDGARRLTYSELNGLANQVAHHLRSLGVRPEVHVGICLERSAQVVIAILACLKSGGAYVPMDPAYPKDRRNYILQDARASVLITDNKTVEAWPELLTSSHAQPLRILKLDADRAAVSGQSRQNPLRRAGPAHLAYVLFTSGSTGRPKGVAIEQQSVVALLHWAHNLYTAKELAGVLFSTSICFDLSIFELLVPLTSGGKVILTENILHLPHLPAALEVTLVNTVPSAMQELVRIGAIPQSVITVNLAGEPLATSLVDQIYAFPSIQHVYDLYGPTEDTTYSTFTLRQKGEAATIGKPLANEQVYILDKHFEPVPIGVSGELHIGGVKLARGYLNHPELTQEKFVANPFKNQPGSRLYKTGDLARFRPDGNIEYLGRIDHQVKIRGFRIELGEIESVLRKHSGVTEAVVLARQDSSGQSQLVGYVVASQKVAASELRDHVRRSLPDYMTPALFVMLDALPLTPNKKIDRKALSAMEPDRTVAGKSFTAPRTPTEAALAGIWKEVLNVPAIGVDDNFFELGGHSLLAIQVVARLHAMGHGHISLKDLFEAGTVGGLASRIDEADPNGATHEPPPLSPIPRAPRGKASTGMGSISS